MTTVLLVRHGETRWNRERRLQGWAPTRLTERGREQAATLGEAIAEAYDVTAIRSSDLPRCSETAAGIRESVDADLELDPGWRERDFGCIQGFTYEQLDERFPEYSVAEAGADAVDRRPESGESLLEMRDRVVERWERIVDEAGADDTVLVVTHGGPLYVLLGHLDGRDLVAAILDYTQHNCAINEVRAEGGTATIVRENHTDGW